MKASFLVAGTCLAVVVLTAVNDRGWAGDSQKSAPITSAEQIESDWLRQEEVWGRRDETRERPKPSEIAPEVDAAGGVDGHIDGRWGFHTANEPNPWWQVDLGDATPLDRIVLYNRCDSNMPRRNGKILILLSDDGIDFDRAYQHDGTVFLGHPDKKPLVVKLDGREARFVRLQLPGKSFFHLDEVEIYTPGRPENVALGKPATQSSTSPWSAPPHGSRPVVLRRRFRRNYPRRGSSPRAFAWRRPSDRLERIRKRRKLGSAKSAPAGTGFLRTLRQKSSGSVTSRPVGPYAPWPWTIR